MDEIKPSPVSEEQSTKEEDLGDEVQRLRERVAILEARQKNPTKAAAAVNLVIGAIYLILELLRHSGK